MSENKQLDRVKEITDQLEAGIHDLFESERYQQWLTTMECEMNLIIPKVA